MQRSNVSWPAPLTDSLPLEAVADFFDLRDLYAFLCSSRRGHHYATSGACWQVWPAPSTDTLPLEAGADFLDLRDLYAFLCSSRRGRHYATSEACWQGWREAWLAARLPGHVRWQPSQDPKLRKYRPCPLWRASFSLVFAEGIRLYELRDFAGAVHALRAAAGRLPQPQGQVACRLADALYEQALELKAAAASAAHPAYAHKAAIAVAGEIALREASDLYQKVHAADPTDSYAVTGLALFAGSAREKRRLLEEAVVLDDVNPSALANLAAELLGEDDERALDCVERALAANPRLFSARLLQTQALLQLGRLDRALEAIAQQLAWHPGDVLAQRLLSQYRCLSAVF